MLLDSGMDEHICARGLRDVEGNDIKQLGKRAQHELQVHRLRQAAHQDRVGLQTGARRSRARAQRGQGEVWRRDTSRGGLLLPDVVDEPRSFTRGAT